MYPSAQTTKKLYDIHPYEKTFFAEVLSCRKGERSHQGQFDIILDQTLFFPEEGGQTPDLGLLAPAAVPATCSADALSSNQKQAPSHNEPTSSEQVFGLKAVNSFDQVNVLDVKIKSGIIHHFCDSPLAVGAHIQGTIDWERRYDNMQNHSGEHIFSGLVHSAFGYENVGFHLSERTCSMDYNGPLAQKDIDRIELLANRVICGNRAIDCSYPSAQVLKQLDYRSKKELSGPVRIVTIPGCDVCACCAPHVRRTGEIGLLKVLRAQSYKGGTRLLIACGTRALLDFRRKQSALEEVSHLLSSPQEEAAETLTKKLAEFSSLKDALHEASARLLEYDMAGLDPSAANVCLFENGIDPIRLRNAVNRMTARHKGYCATFNGSDADGYSYILSVADGDARILNEQLREHFSARGGGSAAMCQGSLRASRRDLESFFSAL